MDATGELRRILISLNASQEEDLAVYYVTQLQEFLGNIHYYFNPGQVLETLFAETNGILRFLRSRANQNAFVKPKKVVFTIIKDLLDDKSIDASLVVGHCLGIKNTLNCIWKNLKEQASIQSEALQCYRTLLQNYGSHVSAQDMDASDLYRTLLAASEKSAFMPSVRGEIFHLLGLIAFIYKDEVLVKVSQDQLLRHLVFTIKSQVESSHAHIEASILVGSIRAVDYFLTAYGRNYVDELKSLHDSMEKIVNPRISISFDASSAGENKQIRRREFQRATLTLIEHHGDLFKKHIYPKHKQWFEDLLTWCRSSNTEDSVVARAAMLSFLRVICHFLSEPCYNEERISLRRTIINFLTTEFLKILDGNDVLKTDLTISIQGIGLLTAISLDSALQEQLISRVFLQVEKVNSELKKSLHNYSPNYSILHSLHTYMDCIAQLLLTMEVLEEDASQKFQVRLILTEQLCSLYLKFYPRLNKKYKDEAGIAFLKIIRNLYIRRHVHVSAFLETVFHDALNHMIAAPTKLDEDAQSGDIDDMESEPDQKTKRRFKASTAANYFYSWVSLLKSSTQSRDPVSMTCMLYDCCIQWCLDTISKLDLSLVDSGELPDSIDEDISDPVYRMRANVPRDFQLFVNLVDFLQVVILKTDSQFILKWIPTFIAEVSDSVQKCSGFISGFYSIMQTVFSLMKNTCYFQSHDGARDKNTKAACDTFLNSLGTRVKEFRDNLLFSVLEVWLAAPDELISSVLSKLGNVLHCVFSIGQNNLQFALRGVDAMERWFEIETISIQYKQDLFSQLFPDFLKYFSSRMKDDEEGSKIQIRSNVEESSTGSDLLSNVHSRVLRLIGSYGHFFKVEDSERKWEGPMMVVENKMLKFSVPFQDIQPDLYLDTLLPRILELCNNATDRQVRSSACESFHTLILHFLGHSTNVITAGKHEELFQRIFSQVMKLGCDSDFLVRQLFNPLAIQMVHYFTSKTENYDTFLVQIIVDGLTQSENAQLRDFSSVCIGECFSWSLKTRDLNKGTKTEQVMKTICALSTHAAPNYRQASVLAFNSIYRDFREDERLVNTFTLQLIHSFILSLCLPSEFGSDSILIQSTKQAVKHLMRIILQPRYREHFNLKLVGRNCPAELSGSSLADLVDWIFGKAGDSRTIWGREECLGLLEVFAPAIKGVASVQAYFATLQVRFDVSWVLDRIETKKNIEDLMEYIKTALDIYAFLIKFDYPVEKILTHPDSKFVSKLQEILEIVSYEQLSNTFILKVGQVLAEPTLMNLFSREVKRFFLISSLSQSARDRHFTCLPDLEKVWEVLYEDTLKEECRRLVLDATNFSLWEKAAERKVSNEEALEALGILEWLKILGVTTFLRRILTTEDMNELIAKCGTFIGTKLFYLGQNNRLESSRLTTQTQELLLGMMSLSIQLQRTKDIQLLDLVFNSEEVIFVDGKLEEKMTKGGIAQEVLLPSLLNSDEIYDFKRMMTNVKLEHVGSLITRLIQTVKKKKVLREKFGQKLVTGVISVWKPLSLNFDSEIVNRILCGLIGLDIEATKNSQELCDWWVNLMTSTQKIVEDKLIFIDYLPFFGVSSTPEIQQAIFNSIERLNETRWEQEKGSFIVNKLFDGVLCLCQRYPDNLDLLKSFLQFFVRMALSIEQYHEGLQDDCSASCHHFSTLTKTYKLFETVIQNIQKVDPRGERLLGLTVVENIYKLIEIGNPTSSRLLFKFCALPCLLNLPEKQQHHFYLNHIFEIVSTACIQANTQGDWISKTTALSLFETLALITNIEFMKGALNDAFVKRLPIPPKKPAEVLRVLLNAWIQFQENPFQAEKLNKRTRKFQYASIAGAYNSVAAIFLSGKYGEKLFMQFLINDIAGHRIWEKLVDCETEIFFPVVNESTTDEGDDQDSTAGVKKKQAGNSGSHLEGSSLATEASDFDFTIVRSETEMDDELEQEVPIRRPISRGLISANNVMNKHDCMETLVRIIRHLNTNSNTTELPVWMDSILQKLNSGAVHGNIKAFLCGLILNCEKIFKPFAANFLQPIMDLISAGCFLNDPIEKTNSLNSFEKELILMLLGWTEIHIPGPECTEKLFSFCVRKVSHERKDVRQQNLEFLTEITKSWIRTEFTPASYAVILRMLGDPQQTIGILVVNSILNAGVLPCTEETIRDFIAGLGKYLSSSLKGTYALAAETLGKLLKICKETRVPHFSKTVSRVRNFLTPGKGRIQAFIAMLNAFALSYPAILVSYKAEIGVFLKHKPEVRREAMSLLTLALKEELRALDEPVQRKDAAKALFIDLQGRDIFGIECSDDSECHLGVNLLSLFLETDFGKEYEPICQVVQWVHKAEESGDVTLRLSYATAMSKVYTIFATLEIEDKSELQKKFVESFIRMSSDEDKSVRAVVHEFWANNLIKWDKSPYLLLELLETLAGSPRCVAVSLELLINRCSTSPGFGKLVFDTPLSDLPYQEYKLFTGANTQNATFQPLFVDSYSSFATGRQSTMMMSQSRTSTHHSINLLRATLPLSKKKFAMTQESSAHMTGEEPMDTYEWNSAIDSAQEEVARTDNSYRDPMGSLRRKFYTRIASQHKSEGFKKPGTWQTKKIRPVVPRQKKGDGNVKLVRSYRIGELPDILITYSELLLALTSLAKVDEQFAKVFLTILSIGIVELEEKRQANFIENVQSTFQTILQSDRTASRYLLSTIFDVSTKCNIPIQSHLVCDASINGKLVTSGILKLEQDLRIGGTTIRPTPAKRAKLTGDQQNESAEDTWLRTAQLYREIQELDSVRSIYSHLAACARGANYETALEALYYENVGNYLESEQRYDYLYDAELKKDKSSSLKLQLWNDGLQRAFVSLSEWGLAHDRGRRFTEDLGRLDVPVILKRNLIHSAAAQRLQSGVQHLVRLPFSADISQKATELKEWFLGTEDIGQIVEKFPVYLALISFLEGDMDACSSKLRGSTSLFSKSFQHFEELSPSEKDDVICELRRTASLYDVMDLSTIISMPGKAANATRKVLGKWNQLMSTINTPMETAEIVIGERNFFLEKILRDLPEEVGRDSPEIIHEIAGQTFRNNLWVVKMATIHQRNFVGNSYLNLAKRGLESEELSLSWRQHFCSLICSSDLRTYNEIDWAKQWASAWKKLVRSNFPQADELQAELLQNLVTISCGRELLKETIETLSKVTPLSNSDELVPTITDWLNSVTASGIRVRSINSFQVDFSGGASLKLFRLMRTMKSKFPSNYRKDERLHRNLLVTLLHAMKLQHPDAAKNFPDCFHILEEFPTLGGTFVEMVAEVDGWLFLPWLDQIMTTHAYKPALKPLLEPTIQRLFLEYPEAFQLQHEKLNDIPNLRLPEVLDSFEKALSAVKLPEVLFKEEIAYLKEKYPDIAAFPHFITRFVKKLQDVLGDVVFHGVLHQVFAKEVYTKLIPILTPYPQFAVELEDVFGVLNEIKPVVTGALQLLAKRVATNPAGARFRNLKDLSPWLANFHFSSFKETLEVPGRNFGFESSPTELTQPRVVSFESVVRVYGSKTSPILLTMVGNDGQKYSFIAKCDEDLRQDKRLQQLFRFSNSILKSTSECRKRDLRVMTYSVIPITKDFGLIQYISRTRSLKEFIFKSPTLEQKCAEACTIYKSWIGVTTNDDYSLYGTAAMKTPGVITSAFEKVTKTLQPDLFLENVQTSVDSFEKFFALRQRLIRSLGTMSFVNWIFGIGDRHLENCMISLGTGEFLGIDFGFAFGAGVTLPIPELVPFRLTPQLQSLLEPYGKHGMLKETMGYTMRALSHSSEFILSTADVFVCEPLAAWSRKKKPIPSNKDPRRQVEIIEEKLNGKNPIDILVGMIKTHTTHKFVPYWTKALMYDRGELDTKTTLSDDESVEVLINLATDPRILGIAFAGWSSWV